MKELLTLLGAVTVVGIVTAIAVSAINKGRAPSGDHGVWVYSILPEGKKFAAAIAPDSGDNWAWKFVGRAFVTSEDARVAAIDAITKVGGSAREFLA